jgi:multiple sugar transport system ATP-binding protein
MNFLSAARIGRDSGRILGIRPEHLAIDPEGPLAGTVTHVEKLGGDTNAIVDLGDGEAVTVRLFGQHPIAPEESVSLRFDPSRAFFFEKDGSRAAA